MSRLTQSIGWVWKPLAAVALAMLLASWADAAPPTSAGTTTATGTGTASSTTSTGTATDGTTFTMDGPYAEIVALAQFLADELELTFEDPLEEMYFFFAVAELYTQVQRQQMRTARYAARGGVMSGSVGGTASGTGTRTQGGTAGGATLGSLTTVVR